MTTTTCRSETLAEWLRKHRGAVVQIGTENGSGFLYAGKAGAFTLDAMRNTYRAEFGALEVLSVYPSCYAGYIVIIPGAFSGKAELPLALVPKFPEAPMENYVRFADYWAAEIVKDYKAALLSVAMGSANTEAENTIIQAEKFLHSELFSAICQKADGDEIIRLIKQQVAKEVREHEERRRKQAERFGLY